MATIDDLAIEMVNAREQLKSINNTINKDRKVLSDIEKNIEDKNNELEDLKKAKWYLDRLIKELEEGDHVNS